MGNQFPAWWSLRRSKEDLKLKTDELHSSQRIEEESDDEAKFGNLEFVSCCCSAGKNDERCEKGGWSWFLLPLPANQGPPIS
jgi:hypothetical protein